MKKSFAGLLCATVLISAATSCKKTANGNKNILVETTETTVKSDSLIKKERHEQLRNSITGNDKESKIYPYRALDGSAAKVTFNNGSAGQLTIEAHDNKFELDKKAPGNYERNGISAKVKGDSLIIVQDGNEIPLVFAQ